MRSVRTLRPESLHNLVRNGGLDFGTEFWAFSGHTPALTSAVQDHVDGSDRYLRYQLDSDVPATITQSFRLDATMDFPVPTGPLDRPVLQGGYQNAFGCLLGRSRDFSIGISVAVISGSATITAEFLDKNLATISSSTLDVNRDAFFTARSWSRVSGVFTAVNTPSYLRLSIVRTKAELCDVRVAKIQLSPGAYDDVPYTGDLAHTIFPSGTVIMVMGATCPAGFAPLASSPSGNALWADHGIETHLNAFPVAADSADGTEVGDPTHNKEDGYEFELSQDHIVQLESFDSAFGPTTGAVSHNPFVKSPADVPSDGTADHQHNVEEGGSIPVNRQFLFCKRVDG